MTVKDQIIFDLAGNAIQIPVDSKHILPEVKSVYQI